jgi:copper chaperone CopZ
VRGRKILFAVKEAAMNKISLRVPKELCVDCSLALRRFIGGMEGVDSIDVENGKIEISFDASKIAKDTLVKISKDSVEKLGYELLDVE